jgi:hypothetical protein
MRTIVLPEDNAHGEAYQRKDLDANVPVEVGSPGAIRPVAGRVLGSFQGFGRRQYGLSVASNRCTYIVPLLRYM